MPEMGFGIRYTKKIEENLSCEVRVSPGKLGGFPQQQVFYITNRLNVMGTVALVKWTPAENPAFDLTRNAMENGTHINYALNDQKSVFDFLRSQTALAYFKQYAPRAPNLVIPICQCQ